MSVTLQSVNIHTYTQGTRVGEYGALRTLSFKVLVLCGRINAYY